ncbi:M23 family metallopeptidase [Luteimonas vadosa]|uniref:M23 family metallopeptidase n=1 Tax=Luteimonas vadosa TaxID=1165507 RepID=UPI0031ED7359
MKTLAGLLFAALALAALAFLAWNQGAVRPVATGSAEQPTIAVPDAGAVATEDTHRPRIPAAPAPQARSEGPPQGVAHPVPKPIARPVPSAAGLVIPVAGITAAQLSDTYTDARGSERTHEAMDIMAPTGTPVLAVADGHVEKLFDSDRGGLTIYQFEPSGRYCYYYAHLQRYAPRLREGQEIKRGQVIGYVGSTGNADPNAPHLHFAVFLLGPEREWWRGTPVNPYPLLGGR